MTEHGGSEHISTPECGYPIISANGQVAEFLSGHAPTRRISDFESLSLFVIRHEKTTDSIREELQMKVFKMTAVMVLLFSALIGIAKEPAAMNQPLAKPYFTSDLISLQPTQDRDIQSFRLIVSGPEGLQIIQSFSGVNVPFIELYDLDGNLLPDGQYSYELRGTPFISEAGKAALRQARDGVGTMKKLVADGVLPQQIPVQSGYFTIQNGFFVLPGMEEPRLTIATRNDTGRADNDRPGKPTGSEETGGVNDVGEHDGDGPRRDQVILDDLIVDGSACIGFDCVNGESFGFDTIRLKENNLRIKFEDTSVAASFPSVDWQLTANASANGGANKFSIDDISGGRTPFTVEANAPSHSLYVDDGGRLGLGTSIPVVDIHAVSGNTPTLRLEQNGTSGFAPQTWDVAGNETNFFIRDATNGSQLPFRIRPGAPSSSIFIDTDGDVGIGDTSPDADLDVENGWMRISDNSERLIASGEASFLVEQSAASNSHVLMRLASNGSVNFLFEDTSDAVIWKMVMNGGGGSTSVFQISRDGSGANEFEITHGGNVNITGTLTESSDVNRKENIATIDPTEVLNKVLAMPVTTWNYLEEDNVTHMGPMAQDFHAAFGLGATDKGIANIDSSGVAFGAIQGLHQVIDNKDKEIKELKQLLTALEARLAALEEDRSK